MITRMLERLLGVTALDRIYDRARRRTGSIFQEIQRLMDMPLEIAPEDLRRIPRDGPVIFVANHPMGAVEGVALPALLESVRNDAKTLAHVWFDRWPRMAERMVLVNPQARAGDRTANGPAIADATRWVQTGHALLLFPAGEVARYDRDLGKVTDPPWRKSLARLIHNTGATVVPIHVCGRNRRRYDLLSRIHPRLGALLLAREALHRRGRPLRVRVGEPLPYAWIRRLGSATAVIATLRNEVERLGPVESPPAVSCYGVPTPSPVCP